MAENLLEYDGWFPTLGAVRDRIDDFKSANLIEPEFAVKDILSERVRQLEDLRNLIYRKELSFFNSFDCLNGLPPKAALETLQMKVGVWNASGARHMVSNNTTDTILKILTSPDYRRLGIHDVEDIVSDFLTSEGGQIFHEAAAASFEEQLLEKLNEVLEKNEVQKLATKKKQKVNGERVAYVYFEIYQLISK